MKKLQVLDKNALAMTAKYLAIMACYPHPSGGEAQVTNLSLSPAVDAGSSLSTLLADGSKPLVGLNLNMSDASIGSNLLTRYFYSTIGEVWCYAERGGHRRPPWIRLFFSPKTNYPKELPDVHQLFGLPKSPLLFN
jgi:hypothetical protein